MWQVLISSDLPVNPEFDLLREQYRKFNELVSRAQSGVQLTGGAKLFIVFREPDRLIDGKSVVDYDKLRRVFDVSSPANRVLIRFGCDGFDAIKQRVIEEYDRAQDFARFRGVDSLEPSLRDLIMNIEDH